MDEPETDPAFEAFRGDFVAYLASKLGIAPEAALERLGDWLVSFELEGREQRALRVVPGP